MTSNLILLPIVIPLIAGLLTLPIRRLAAVRTVIALIGTAAKFNYRGSFVQTRIYLFAPMGRFGD